MASSEEQVDVREGQQQEGDGGRSSRTGLGSRLLRRNRGGGGADVAERPTETMPEPEAMSQAQPASSSDADAWFSFAEQPEYDEWGDPIVKGIPRGPNTVGLRQMSFDEEDESSP